MLNVPVLDSGVYAKCICLDSGVHVKCTCSVVTCMLSVPVL